MKRKTWTLSKIYPMTIPLTTSELMTAKGFGFDICIECHNLAPFPNAAHLRAAEEHLGMLDALWREKWEAPWYAKEEYRTREAQSELTVNDASSSSWRILVIHPPPVPPRLPPHANAVIHLPFPSSPLNSQTTMVALLPVICFLEKWIRPVPPASNIIRDFNAW